MGFNISWFNNKTAAQTSFLKGISMQFFHLEELICKAEWAFEDGDIEADEEVEDVLSHPQPHWHFVKQIEGLIERKKVKPQGFMEFVGNNNVGQQVPRFGVQAQNNNDEETEVVYDSFEVNRMHFAQLERWLDDTKNPSKIDYKHIKNWIEKCIKSVQYQHDFHYVSN